MTTDLTDHEVYLLEILAESRRGGRGEWGSWMGAALESLQGKGYCTRGPHYHITDRGREALDEYRRTTNMV